MKRALILLIMLVLLFGHAAPAKGISEDQILAGIEARYPDWQIWLNERYYSGMWENESALNCDIGLFRLLGKQIEIKQLSGVLNPLFHGGELEWKVSNWATVPLSDEAAMRIANLAPDDIATADQGFVLMTDALPGCADFLLAEGLVWEKLIAYPDFLIGVAANPEGQQSLRIGHWDGLKYAQITTSPPQRTPLNLLAIHSFNDFLELSTIDVDLILYYCPDGVWQVSATNNGSEMIGIEEFAIIDVTMGENIQSNDERHYGKPRFPIAVTELNILELPRTMQEAVMRLNTEGFACIKADNTRLYDAPGGKLLASCYARTVGQMKESQGEWVNLQIGSPELGLSAWVLRDELAFGGDIESVVCGYPSYFFEDEGSDRLSQVLPGLATSFNPSSDSLWLIGRAPDGRWLVQADGAQVLFADPEAFPNTGPAQHDDRQ